ncbi:ABC transporter ATP-binding protein [Phragmitibacter flavus]|uniref:ABC transporter ATP-binding protein n=1 Tax=Phragmitibacter flavus TaxID=2576071 RepID=A0A5R8KCZ6_9BACT|nr:ABC transporter ATP-binding protein [Phragmitibacter flavus]TLD70182.1 ABC transporter ATP-binding protein [Phragmitibacter flavus]
MISLKNVSKSYANHEVLKDINIEVEEGEFVCIIGYSGTGKTSLMNLISGLAKPDTGEVLLDGKPVTGPGPDRALVFQNYSLLPWLTVKENIALAVNQLYPQWSKEERAAHVDKHVAMVKLSHAGDKFPRELSGGMRQRVSVARALSMDSKVLLLDEPLSALDALTRATLQDDISSIWQRERKTVIWITNDPDEALLLADRVIPLLPTSPATLGKSLLVPIERPRDRKAVNHDPVFKSLRSELINLLLESKAKQRVSISRKLVLPDILPEDLRMRRSRPWISDRGPRRRNEQKQETIELVP